MKTFIIAVCAIAFAFSSPAVTTTLGFSGTVFSSDTMAGRAGFDIGRRFTGYFSFDPEAWSACAPFGDPGAPQLSIGSSAYRTSGNLQSFTLREEDNRGTFSFMGEAAPGNMMIINLVYERGHALNDWWSGEVIAVGSTDIHLNLGTWRGLLDIPRVGLASPSHVPEPGSTALLLTLAVVLVFSMKFLGAWRNKTLQRVSQPGLCRARKKMSYGARPQRAGTQTRDQFMQTEIVCRAQPIRYLTLAHRLKGWGGKFGPVQARSLG